MRSGERKPQRLLQERASSNHARSCSRPSARRWTSHEPQRRQSKQRSSRIALPNDTRRPSTAESRIAACLISRRRRLAELRHPLDRHPAGGKEMSGDMRGSRMNPGRLGGAGCSAGITELDWVRRRQLRGQRRGSARKSGWRVRSCRPRLRVSLSRAPWSAHGMPIARQEGAAAEIGVYVSPHTPRWCFSSCRLRSLRAAGGSCRTGPPCTTSLARGQARSHPRGLLSTARMTKARWRGRSASCSQVRIAQTSRISTGGCCAGNRPRFQAANAVHFARGCDSVAHEGCPGTVRPRHRGAAHGRPSAPARRCRVVVGGKRS
jgi:hypothetical protein